MRVDEANYLVRLVGAGVLLYEAVHRGDLVRQLRQAVAPGGACCALSCSLHLVAAFRIGTRVVIEAVNSNHVLLDLLTEMSVQVLERCINGFLLLALILGDGRAHVGQIANRLYNGEFFSDTLGEVGPRVGELGLQDHIGSQF